ncbi:MAG: ERCC4 domain-containing protein [Candidatus Hodarchaeales archaeon]
MKNGIVIDSREDGKIRQEVIRSLIKHNIEYKVKRLKVGDYLICDVLPIERKTINDYTQSLYSGRLHKQYYELSKNYSFSIVAIIGNPLAQILEPNKIPIATFISSLIGTFMKRAEKGQKGLVIPLQFQTEWEFNLALKYLYDKVRGGDFKRSPKIEKYKISRMERQIRLISSIEGVGPKIAKQLFKRYKSIANLCTVSVEELTTNKRIGDKTAEKIWNTLH